MKTFMRSVLALLAAAVAPAGLFLVPMIVGFISSGANDPFAWSRLSKWLVIVLGTSALYVAVLGVPAFLLLSWRKAIRWWSAILAGFAMACLPVAYSLWPAADPDLRTTASHWNGEQMIYTMIDGVPTLEGWIRYAESVGAFGLLGAVGGFAGWLVWRMLRPRGEEARA